MNIAKYKQSIFDIVNSFVTNMTFNAVIYKVTNVGNIYTLNVDDVYHATIGMVITINGHQYTVVNWNENYLPQDEIMQLVVNDLTGSNPIIVTAGTPLAFSFPNPLFAHGTVYEQATNMINNEQSAINLQYPLIWVKEGVKEKEYNDRNESHDRDSELEIYFLTNSDFSTKSENIYENYTRPMTRLKDNFVESMNTETGAWPIGAVDREGMTIDIYEITKVGVTINQQGNKKNLFGRELSGVGIKFTMKLFAEERTLFI